MITYPEKNTAKQKGAVLVELVFVTVFFLLPILFGIIEFGRIFYFYQKIVHQVQYAGRYLSVQTPGDNHEKAKCFLLAGEPIDNCENSNYFINGVSSTNIVISNIKGVDVDGASVPMNFVTVKVDQYKYDFLFLKFLMLESIEFNPISATYRQVN